MTTKSINCHFRNNNSKVTATSINQWNSCERQTTTRIM